MYNNYASIFLNQNNNIYTSTIHIDFTSRDKLCDCKYNYLLFEYKLSFSDPDWNNYIQRYRRTDDRDYTYTIHVYCIMHVQ